MLRLLYLSADTRLTREPTLLDLMAGLTSTPLPGRASERYEPVLAIPGEGSLADAARAAGIETHILPIDPMPADWHPRAWIEFLLDLPARRAHLATFLDEQGIDLLHATSPEVGLTATLAARTLGIPTVWAVRDGGASDRLRAHLRRRLLQHLPTQVVATAESALRPLLAQGIRAALLPDGMDVAQMQQRAIRGHGTIWREYGIPLRRPLIGLVGTPTPTQGQLTFLSAAARIAASRRDARFLLVNREPPETPAARAYQAELEQVTLGLGLEEYVVFGGTRSEVGALLVDLDILVHCPTTPDPVPFVVVEAMALGIPVVTSTVGTLPDLVADGETGFLVRPDDPGAIAAAVLALLAPSATERRHEMARQAQQRAQMEFGLNSILRRASRIYDSLLDIKRPVTGAQRAIDEINSIEDFLAHLAGE